MWKRKRLKNNRFYIPTLDDGTKLYSDAKKSDRSFRNGVDNAAGFLQ